MARPHLRVQVPLGFEAERRYAVDVTFRDWLGLEVSLDATQRADVLVTAVGDESGRSLTMPDLFFAGSRDTWLQPGSLPGVLAGRWTPASRALASQLVGPLPILFASPRATGNYWSKKNTTLALGLDVLGTIFFMLTRYEEVVQGDLDAHGRHLSTSTIAVRAGFAERPLANEYLEVLWSALAELWPWLERRRRDYAVALTHDIDRPFGVAGKSTAQIARAVAGDLSIRRDVGLAAKRLALMFAPERQRIAADPNLTFDFIMRVSERYGLRSLFFVMTGVTDAKRDGNYSVEAPPIRHLLREMHARGHLIGLHPSYGSFDSPSQIRTEFATLLQMAEREGIRQAAWGGRQHYLRFRVPATWRAYETARLAFDTSLGYPDRIGFRCGTCYDFPVFDLIARRPLALREQPLLAMEVAVCRGAYTRRKGVAVREGIARIVDRCRTFGGTFTLLWHNDSLIGSRQRRLYLDIVDQAAAAVALSTALGEVVRRGLLGLGLA